jgi:hypothetical protein
MLYVSKYAQLRVPILLEKKKFLGQNTYGAPEWAVEIPHFTAEFLPVAEGGPPLLYRDRLAAYQHFAGPNGRLFQGSADRDDGISQEIGLYEGSQEEYLLGAFDTERLSPVQVADSLMVFDQFKTLVETRLREIGEASQWQDFVQIGPEILKPPWPSYEETHHNQVLGLVKQLGLAPLDVAAYERARDKPRESVLSQLEAYASELQRAASDAAALEVTIGG